MDNLKKIKKIALWLVVLMVANLVVLAIMLPVINLWIVTSMVVQVIIAVYLAGIIAALLREYRELDEKHRELMRETEK